MLVTATILIMIGVLSSVLGLKLFKLLLPFLGFVTGFMVGFLGVQAIFGTGVVSTAMSILVAFIVGVMIALLSYLFFDISVTLFAALIGGTAFSYMGVALGLSKEGFVVFLFSLGGAILGAMIASRYALAPQIVVTLTAMLGVAYILAGFLLVVGRVSLNDINSAGVSATILKVVDQSFLWFFVWLGGSIVAMQVQYRLALIDVMDNMFEYQELKTSKKK